MAMFRQGTCEGKPTDKTRYYGTSVMTGSKVLLCHV